MSFDHFKYISISNEFLIFYGGVGMKHEYDESNTFFILYTITYKCLTQNQINNSKLTKLKLY